MLSTYTYFWGSLLGIIIFFVIYLLRKDLRREMIKTGLVVGVIGILSEAIFFKDYWSPPLIFRIGNLGGIEDFMFGFAAGGIGTALYKVIFHKRLVNRHNPHYWIIPIVLISEFFCVFILGPNLDINSIFSSTIGFLIPIVIISIFRKDLIIEIICSAILTGAIILLGETIFLIFAPSYLEKYFLLYNKVWLVFGLVPITEVAWGIALGALLGPLYEFSYGDGLMKLFVKKKKRRLK